ncbi:spore coat protein [Desulfosporosinus youngiae]|uniref:Coat F domain-containing protein n=1 Tax=Desulfosporosinus youngiae DSM 17734 TaxID=768710 RepID=H5XTL3_9FIRM|nr:spore coat protein [Desulfosporosinus youngiae]EHQ88612.1 coat F domain-containing protein [Desulfosporosinus youngiae DSM 17734]
MIQLSEKEKLLLMDQKTHEEICVDKYAKYANQAQDPQLKQLFNSYSGKEQVHLDTINQLLSGQMPNMGGQQNQGQQGQNQQGQQAQPQQMPNPQQMAGGNQAYNQVDAKLCTDMLMTEKYVSGAYDTAIFEFRDPNIRQILNHIQKEEQEHGEGIFQYMQGHGMYQVH